ncbi:MAG: SLC13 family permease [Planctomycetota bacterium]
MADTVQIQAALTGLLASGTGGETSVPGYQTVVFGGILVLTLLLLATEAVQKTVLVLLSALFCLFLADAWHLLPHSEGHHLPVYVRFIEWEVIGIVIGATIFVEVSARSGVFTWVSVKMLKASRGDPFRLLIFLSILTAIFSAFLDNITAMIIIGSLTVVACRKLELDAKPFLITEGIMTNVGGLLTLISSIPNIIVGKAAGISYVKFLIVTGPYAVVATIATLLIARKLFGTAVAPVADRELRGKNLAQVMAFDEWETVKNKRFFYTSIVGVILVILGFALKDKIWILRDFGIEVVAMLAAALMLLLHADNVEHDLDDVEWSLVFFFVGLFVIIGVMEKANVLLAIGKLLDSVTERTGPYGLMWLTAGFSSVTDNIPLAAMLAKIFGPTREAADAFPITQWWAVVFGANLGGNITPIGSASTVVACTIMKKHGIKITFMEFVKVGGVFAVVQLGLASVYLYILSMIL